MKRKIRKVLIANRGEIAVRVIRTCKEMNIVTVAVFSEIDRTMPHVRFADEAYCIGKATAAETYLQKEKIIEVALKSGCDAIHPGYGFLSENSTFSQMVDDAGLIFIGPPAVAIKAMGDKVAARNLVKMAGVPIVPGTDAPITNLKIAYEFGDQFQYPILLKAAGGGGGKGMRIVHKEDELESAFRGAQSEAKSAFSDDRVYIEKYLENPRHIEFQILADKYGNAVHLGERECSIQRRHQKIIEESPSVIITPQMREEMGRSATMAAISAKYVNAGTIEFLVDEHRKYYFLEMNTRLQVEHPVTEMRTGVDLVKEQIYIAMGEPLKFKQNEIKFDGHALECRIYAEDSENNFLPSIGTITKLRSPQGFGIREDRGVDVGNQISVYYDPMISKLIAWAKTREDVINRMTLALNEYDLTGVKTNINLCKWIINHPKFVEGDFNTHFLNENYNFNEMKKKRTDIRKVLSAAVCLIHKYEKNEHSEIRTVSTNGLQSSKWKLKRYEHLKD
ncbi:MAG: acetyl-CoA carboxylase biotin carboxylase subunit [Bacteroidetes bacterium]|nr:acetyl-CoA carboxylase biotin carboxylase subunit [Bacteroidota bacterium]